MRTASSTVVLPTPFLPASRVTRPRRGMDNCFSPRNPSIERFGRCRRRSVRGLRSGSVPLAGPRSDIMPTPQFASLSTHSSEHTTDNSIASNELAIAAQRNRLPRAPHGHAQSDHACWPREGRPGGNTGQGCECERLTRRTPPRHASQATSASPFATRAPFDNDGERRSGRSGQS